MDTEYSALIPLASLGKGPLIACIPGAGSTVSSFIDLAAQLGDSYRMYGLQPRGVDGKLPPYASVDEAATCYLRAISAFHCDVHLVGHSFGGYVAFEMALQLLQQGAAVASLTLIDCESPAQIVAVDDKIEATMLYIEVCEQLSECSMNISIEDMITRTSEQQRDLIHKRMVSCKILPSRSRPDLLIGPMRTFFACLSTAYTPSKAYSGEVHLILAADPKLDAAGNDVKFAQTLSGWSKVAPRTQCYMAEGNHMTVLQSPQVDLVANLLHKLAGRSLRN